MKLGIGKKYHAVFQELIVDAFSILDVLPPKNKLGIFSSVRWVLKS
jgi:hypothetical protein